MKKFIISLMLFLVSFVAFANEKIDARGNLSRVQYEEMNGAYYGATLHFASKETIYFGGLIKDEKFFFITDGEEAYLIPNEEITQVYWKYPVEISKLSSIIEEDCEFIITLLNQMHDGSVYVAHTEYEIYENYLNAIERGEDAKFIDSSTMVAHK